MHKYNYKYDYSYGFYKYQEIIKIISIKNYSWI